MYVTVTTYIDYFLIITQYIGVIMGVIQPKLSLKNSTWILFIKLIEM